MQERKKLTKKEIEEIIEDLREFFGHGPNMILGGVGSHRNHGLCQPGPNGCIYGKGSCDENRFRPPELPESGMLTKAKEAVDKNMAKYGVPTESWERIGRMWGAYLGIDAIPAWKCLHMMSQMKEVRETYERNPDNNLDAVGYIDCAERVIVDELEGSDTG